MKVPSSNAAIAHSGEGLDTLKDHLFIRGEYTKSECRQICHEDKPDSAGGRAIKVNEALDLSQNISTRFGVEVSDREWL